MLNFYIFRGFPGYYENFLVCNYGPAANVWKQPVYDIGDLVLIKLCPFI